MKLCCFICERVEPNEPKDHDPVTLRTNPLAVNQTQEQVRQTCSSFALSSPENAKLSTIHADLSSRYRRHSDGDSICESVYHDCLSEGSEGVDLADLGLKVCTNAKNTNGVDGLNEVVVSLQGGGRIVSSLHILTSISHTEEDGGHTSTYNSIADEVHLEDKATLQWLNELHGCSATSYANLPDMYKMLDRPACELKVVERLRAEFPDSINFHSDMDLWRFCKARDFVWKDVLVMYSKFTQEVRLNHRLGVSTLPFIRPALGWEWERLRCDPLLTAPLRTRDQADTAWLTRLYRCFQDNVVFAEDRAGRPVIYTKMYTPLKLGIVEKIPLEIRLLFQGAMYKQLAALCHYASHRHRRLIFRCTLILDVGDASVIKCLAHAGRAETQLESAFMADFFPERVAKIMVLNAPLGAGTVWNFVKSFLPKSTSEKVSIHGSCFENEMRKLIHPDRLPKMYGGNAEFEYPERQDFDTFTDY